MANAVNPYGDGKATLRIIDAIRYHFKVWDERPGGIHGGPGHLAVDLAPAPQVRAALMAQDFTFDVVSKLDLQEVENAVNQANKEIQTRFDFKGSVSRIDWDKKEVLTLYSDDEQKLKSVIDILQGKFSQRGISLQALDYQKLEPAEKATVRQAVKMKQGIESEKAKAVVKAIKDAKIKVQASIQGDQLRVSSKSKDDLQTTMNFLRGQDFGLPLQFTNFR